MTKSKPIRWEHIIIITYNYTCGKSYYNYSCVVVHIYGPVHTYIHTYTVYIYIYIYIRIMPCF